MWKKIKNYFIAGLIAILPLAITYIIAKAIFKIVFPFLGNFAKPILKFVPYLNTVPYLLNIISALVTILIIMFVGVLLTNVVGRRFFLILEKTFQRIPLLSWIYSAIRKLTSLFYEDDGNSRFRRVVMIEYPRKGVYVIGFMTTRALEDFNLKSKQELVNIFLPTTPNPTSGFLLMVPKHDVIPLEISTEDAVKLIISGGITAPGGELP